MSKQIFILNPILNVLTLLLVCVFLIFYICFPQIRVGNTAIYTLFLYALTIISIFLFFYKKDKSLDLKAVKEASCIIVKFIGLSLIGFLFALLFSGKACFIISTFLSSNFILLAYCFTFSVICQYRNIRSVMVKTIVFAACAVGIYGVFCYITESNLYMAYIALTYGDENIVSGGEIGNAVRGLSHRVSGNIGNPVYYAGELLLLISVCFVSIRGRLFGFFRYIVIACLSLAMMFTGSRSSIGPLVLFYFFFFYRKYGKKVYYVFFLFAAGLWLIYPLLSEIMDIDSFLSSFDLSSGTDDVKGSSFEMRYSQFQGLIDVVDSNIFWGNGVGWVSNYVSQYGHHPILEGFESIVFSSFVDGGIWGTLIVYPFLFVSLYKYILKYSNPCNSYFPKLFFLLFVTFSILTGMYGFKMFIVFYFLIINSTKDVIS